MTAILHFDGVDSPPMYQGATFKRMIVLDKNKLDVEEILEARMQIRNNYGDTEEAEFSTENGRITIVSDSNNENCIVIEIDYNETAAYMYGEYLYDLHIEMMDGTAFVLLKGELNIIPRVTI